MKLVPGCRLAEDAAFIVLAKIRRLDDDDRACVLDWSIHHGPFTLSGPLLFHHAPRDDGKEGALQPLERLSNIHPPNTTQRHRLWELPPGGGSTAHGKVVFSSYYRMHMSVGETYEVVWPGCTAA